MSFITLFSSQHGFIGTDQRIFSADELQHVQQAISQVEQLSLNIASQEQHRKAVELAAQKKGYDQGMLEAGTQTQLALQKELATLHKAHNEDLLAQQSACVDLALDIVRKIAGNVAPEKWLYAEATQAAGELIESEQLVLKVSADQLDAVKTQAEMEAESPFERIVKDDALDPGACCIETRYGKIDVDIETQLAHVAQLLRSESATNE